MKRIYQPEAEVTTEVRSMLNKAGIWHFKHFSGSKGHIRTEAGISDILGAYNVKVKDLVEAGIEEVGIFLALELKATGRSPTSDQHKFLRKVKDGHGLGIWADCKETVVRDLGLAGRLYPLFETPRNVIGDVFKKGGR